MAIPRGKEVWDGRHFIMDAFVSWGSTRKSERMGIRQTTRTLVSSVHSMVDQGQAGCLDDSHQSQRPDKASRDKTWIHWLLQSLNDWLYCGLNFFISFLFLSFDWELLSHMGGDRDYKRQHSHLLPREGLMESGREKSKAFRSSVYFSSFAGGSDPPYKMASGRKGSFLRLPHCLPRG